jgi:hypothetical protein
MEEKSVDVLGNNWGTVVPEQGDVGLKMGLPSAVSC